MKNTDAQEIDHGKVYRVKGCPHCGAKPVLYFKSHFFALDCNEHKDFDVGAVMFIFPEENKSRDEHVAELVDCWNDNQQYLMLEADPIMLESRQFYEVPLSPYPKSAKAKRSGRPAKGKSRPASAAEASR